MSYKNDVLLRDVTFVSHGEIIWYIPKIKESLARGEVYKMLGKSTLPRQNKEMDEVFLLH